MSPLASCSLLWLVTGFCCCRNFCCVWLGSTPPPFRGLGNITSSTILSCTVICSRQNPRLYCTVLCRAQCSSVLYSTDRNCKATFVFPFRDSRKMPLSRLPPEKLTFFRVRGGGNQIINGLIDCLISGLRNWFTSRTQIVGGSISKNSKATSGDASLAECMARASENRV